MESLEKLLLIAVGLLILASFLFWVSPYFIKIDEYKEDSEVVDSYMTFISEIDQAVQYVIRNPEESILKEVEYPQKFNITVNDHYIICAFIIKNKIKNKILVYNTSFYNNVFHDIPPQLYLLNVSYSLSLMIVNFSNSSIRNNSS